MINYFTGNPLEERCTSEGVWRSEVVRRLPNLAKLDGQQCMETEVNLSDAQTELQQNSSEEEEADTSKFKVKSDDEEEEEEKEEEEEEEGKEEKEGDQEEEEEEEGEEEEEEEKDDSNDKDCSGESEVEMSVTTGPVTHSLEPVTEEIGLKEE